MQSFASLLRALDSIKEGDGTLLDHSLIYAFSECSSARAHSVTNMPLFLAGRAGGRLRSGVHIAANGDPVTRVGLTVQRAMGVSVRSWGSGSMETDQQLSELIA
jgi:hypothetical protein